MSFSMSHIDWNAEQPNLTMENLFRLKDVHRLDCPGSVVLWLSHCNTMSTLTGDFATPIKAYAVA